MVNCISFGILCYRINMVRGITKVFLSLIKGHKNLLVFVNKLPKSNIH